MHMSYTSQMMASVELTTKSAQIKSTATPLAQRCNLMNPNATPVSKPFSPNVLFDQPGIGSIEVDVTAQCKRSVKCINYDVTAHIHTTVCCGAVCLNILTH